MTLTDKEREDIVTYRLDKANQSLKQTSDVGRLGYWTLAANRLYYATYYASVALLIKLGHEATTHKGVIRMITSVFVRNGILKVDDSKLLGRLFTMRNSGDYDDLFDWEEADVSPLIPQVEDYIKRVTKLINESEQ